MSTTLATCPVGAPRTNWASMTAGQARLMLARADPQAGDSPS